MMFVKGDLKDNWNKRHTVDVINKHCNPLYFLYAVTQLFDSIVKRICYKKYDV